MLSVCCGTDGCIKRNEEALTTAKHAQSTTTIALRQYETEMADLVAARTEIECVIADFSQAGQNGETRRTEVARELEALQRRIETTSGRLDSIVVELTARLTEERDAKEL